MRIQLPPEDFQNFSRFGIDGDEIGGRVMSLVANKQLKQTGDTKMTSYPIEGNVRCRAFSGEGVRVNRVRFESGDDILVFDQVAGHFTRCHAITPRAANRIRARLYRAVRLKGC